MSPAAEYKRKVRRRILLADIEPRWVKVVARKIKLDRGLGGCGRWTGARTGFSDRHDGRPSWYGMSAAKVAWIMRNREPWPEGHHAAHLCRNRECVNPYHILPMLPSEHYEYDKDYETHTWSEEHEDGETTEDTTWRAGTPPANTYHLSGEGVF